MNPVSIRHFFESRDFLNLGIFIPGTRDFFESRVFYPRDSGFFEFQVFNPRDSGFFVISRFFPEIFIPGIRDSLGFFYLWDISGIFYPRDSVFLSLEILIPGNRDFS